MQSVPCHFEVFPRSKVFTGKKCGVSNFFFQYLLNLISSKSFLCQLTVASSNLVYGPRIAVPSAYSVQLQVAFVSFKDQFLILCEIANLPKYSSYRNALQIFPLIPNHMFQCVSICIVILMQFEFTEEPCITKILVQK